MCHVRYLSLDVGNQWIGIALSDPTGFLATPLRTLRRIEAHGDCIRALIDEHEVQEVVVGLPLNMDGSSGSQVEETYSYVEKLGALQVPVRVSGERDVAASAKADMFPAYDDDGGLLLVLTPEK